MKALVWTWDHPALAALIASVTVAVGFCIYAEPWMTVPVAVAGLSFRKSLMEGRKEREKHAAVWQASLADYERFRAALEARSAPPR